MAVVGGAAGLGWTDLHGGEYQEIPKHTTVHLEKVAEGLTHPLGFEVAPEDADRRFILDQTGQVYIHEENGPRDDPFLDISDKIVDLGVPQLGGYDERGLLGLAFHPNFSNNRKFYVRYSAPNREGTPESYTHTSVLSEFRATEDMSRGDPNSERALMEIPSPQINHNGGQVLFGPDDGYLYISIGDGGGAGDVGEGHVPDWYDANKGGNGQDVKQNLLGGILRIDVDRGSGDARDMVDMTIPGADGDQVEELVNRVEAVLDDLSTGNLARILESVGISPKQFDLNNLVDRFVAAVESEKSLVMGDAQERPYGIPDDNPLVGQKGRDEYYAWGLRNPWRMSFNDGDLFVGDLGQNLFEEVDIVEKGGNYGWNVREGTHGFQTENMLAPPENRPTSTPEDVRGGEPLLDPIIEYAHTGTTETVIDGNSVIGGYVYGTMPGKAIEGSDAMKPLQGKYVFGNWSRRGYTNPEGVLFAATPPEQGSEGTPADYPGSEEVRDVGTQTPEDTTGNGTATASETGTPTNTTGNETTSQDGTASVGNTTTGTDSTGGGRDGSQQLWALEELQIADTEDNELNEFVLSLGRGQDGELYVLTTEEPEPEGSTGKVYKFTGAESGKEDADGASEYTWLDATHDAYWYSFYNLDVVTLYGGNGVILPEPGIADQETLDKRVQSMLKTAGIEEPTVKNPNLNIAPFTTGSAEYTQNPVFRPKPDASTLIWEMAESSKVVSPAALAWTGLKDVVWSKNLQNHLGALPGTDANKFNTMVFGTLPQLSIKWALMEGKLRKNDDDMLLVSEYRPETDEVVDEQSLPLDHASMLWFLSDMNSLAQNGWYGYQQPKPLIPAKKIQQLTDEMATTTMNEFDPKDIVGSGSTRDLGVMLGAVGMYGSQAGDQQLQQQAADYANALANTVSKNMAENGKVENGAENQAATQGVVGQGLLWASQMDGVSHRDMAESALEYMLELWDGDAGTFASGMNDTTYAITAADAGDVTGGINAAEAVLGWDKVQPIFAEYFNNTFNRGRLQRAQLKESYDHADEYLLPLPEVAGGKYGQSPAYNTEVTYDTEADEWEVTDDTFTTAQAEYLADQDVWISNWGGGFYNGRGIPGQTDEPMVVVIGDNDIKVIPENVNTPENTLRKTEKGTTEMEPETTTGNETTAANETETTDGNKTTEK